MPYKARPSLCPLQSALFQAGMRRPWEGPVGAGCAGQCSAAAGQCGHHSSGQLWKPCRGWGHLSMLHFQPWKVQSCPEQGPCPWQSIGIRGSLRSLLSLAILFSCVSKLWSMITMWIVCMWWCSLVVSRAEVMLLQALCRDSPCSVLPVREEGEGESRTRRGKLFVQAAGFT